MAVLGILAVNLAGFAGPRDTSDTPALLIPGATGHASFTDEETFAAVFLIFEGKMRALFSLLFGASMLLFIERAEVRHDDGDLLQARRLFWLGCFGYLHYVLLWWGDILFNYAVCGMFALTLRRLSVRGLTIAGVTGFFAWHLWGALDSVPTIMAEEHVRLGIASTTEHALVNSNLTAVHTRIAQDWAQAHLGFFAQSSSKLATEPEWPLVLSLYTIGETLPLMLLGMALYRSGFFAGQWPRRHLIALATAGLALGLAWTLTLLDWAWLGWDWLGSRHFPPLAMPDILSYWAGPEHLTMALAYAALLMLAAPRLLASPLGQRLEAAGRLAFSNYLLCSAVMCAIFYGWGLGLESKVPPVAQMGLVAAGWAMMLAWSKPWLARFRQGPLEWAWRSLTEWRVMEMRIR